MVELYSSAFNISPQSKIEKPAGTRTPVLFVWTITPRSEGLHIALLDISNLLMVPEEDTLDLSTSLSINGEERVLEDYGILHLPIRIFTVWGISRNIFETIRYIIGFFVFLLMYPILHEFIKRRLGWSKREVGS